MFDELKKYKNSGHFFFRRGDTLREISNAVPEESGVYLIYRLANGRVELVYIGKSGTYTREGFKSQLLRSRINNSRNGMNRQNFCEQKMLEENIEALDIYWYVTFDSKHRDLPDYVEGLIMQRYFDIHGELPPWNNEF